MQQLRSLHPIISLYNVDTTTLMYVTNQPLYTHAYLPKGYFDEAVKESGWFLTGMTRSFKTVPQWM